VGTAKDCKDWIAMRKKGFNRPTSKGLRGERRKALRAGLEKNIIERKLDPFTKKATI